MVFTSKGIETAPNDAVSSTFSLFFHAIPPFQPFTAPARTPFMMYFWQVIYIMIIGSTVIIIHAIMGPIATCP